MGFADEETWQGLSVHALLHKTKPARVTVPLAQDNRNFPRQDARLISECLQTSCGDLTHLHDRHFYWTGYAEPLIWLHWTILCAVLNHDSE